MSSSTATATATNTPIPPSITACDGTTLCTGKSNAFKIGFTITGDQFSAGNPVTSVGLIKNGSVGDGTNLTCNFLVINNNTINAFNCPTQNQYEGVLGCICF